MNQHRPKNWALKKVFVYSFSFAWKNPWCFSAFFLNLHVAEQSFLDFHFLTCGGHAHAATVKAWTAWHVFARDSCASGLCEIFYTCIDDSTLAAAYASVRKRCKWAEPDDLCQWEGAHLMAALSKRSRQPAGSARDAKAYHPGRYFMSAFTSGADNVL